MPKIENWTRTKTHNVSDVNELSGVVRKWENDETGDTLEIVCVKEGDGDHFNIRRNGEDPDLARGTLTKAEDSAVTTMRNFPDGF